MGRTAGSIAAVALGVVLGFVCRGLLEAITDPDVARAPGDGEAASSARAGAFSAPGPESVGEPGDAGDSLRREIEQLHAELAREVARREELEEAFEQLRRQSPSAPEPDSGPGAEGDRGPSSAGVLGDTAHPPWFDEAALLESGLRPSDIDALRERFEEIEMERLYLRDEASREGWFNTPRYQKAERELDLSLGTVRDEFGDSAYDWFLYATGRKNRVVVGGVLESSPAGEAGIQSGDLLISYDGVRIFSGEELVRATMRGEPGRLVALGIQRRDGVERVFVPSGPLGVRLESQRVKPQVRP